MIKRKDTESDKIRTFSSTLEALEHFLTEIVRQEETIEFLERSEDRIVFQWSYNFGQKTRKCIYEGPRDEVLPLRQAANALEFDHSESSPLNRNRTVHDWSLIRGALVALNINSRRAMEAAQALDDWRNLFTAYQIAEESDIPFSSATDLFRGYENNQKIHTLVRAGIKNIEEIREMIKYSHSDIRVGIDLSRGTGRPTQKILQEIA